MTVLNPDNKPTSLRVDSQGRLRVVGLGSGLTEEEVQTLIDDAIDGKQDELAPVSVGALYPTAPAGVTVNETFADEHGHYGFLERSQITFNNAPTLPATVYGHASFASFPTMSGAYAVDHHHDFQGYATFNGSNTIDRLSSFWSLTNHTGSGTITELSQFKANDPIGSGPITNLYGLFVPALTRGTNNWGLYVAGTMPNYVSGRLGLGNPTPNANLHVGSKTFTGVASAYIGQDQTAGAGQFVCQLRITDGITTFATNGNGSTFFASGTLAMPATGTNPLAAGFRLGTPTVTTAGATITETATLHVGPAPTGGTSNYALHVGSGASRIDGPLQLAQFTLATLPSAATYAGCFIDVIDATGGPKLCRSNGAVWQLVNTSTTVS